MLQYIDSALCEDVAKRINYEKVFRLVFNRKPNERELACIKESVSRLVGDLDDYQVELLVYKFGKDEFEPSTLITDTPALMLDFDVAHLKMCIRQVYTSEYRRHK